MKQGLQILVVDDEPSVRQAIKMLLTYDGHQVQAVENGEEALARLKEQAFDLVITDFSMPGMHGDQLISKIRENRPNQPIILATAFAAEYETFSPPSGRANALLLKPFSRLELREAIEKALAGQFTASPDESTQPAQQPPPQTKNLPPRNS